MLQQLDAAEQSAEPDPTTVDIDLSGLEANVEVSCLLPLPLADYQLTHLSWRLTPIPISLPSCVRSAATWRRCVPMPPKSPGYATP